MITELTFAILKYGFLVLLWVFVALAIRSLHRDIASLSPRKSLSHRRKDKLARKKASETPAPAASGPAHVYPSTSEMAEQPSGPSLLVLIDGPAAGASVPLTGQAITLGRSSSNTVVLDDEFVSSHHARVYKDPSTGNWAIEDLGSTNGTIVNQRRISSPTILPSRVPVRIGATTLELR
ncbi:FHA domain-containing protein [uncultured Bifidobacterium sp.]|uniref:FHA domain-containing protein FhaB/FipA n=1 Tax=uncultured Bifidobacterium sp. TaxID=165187 RepID=UPI002610B29E|nr:FHA domain-containing protein [uncultured Bifidobacterium sp.]